MNNYSQPESHTHLQLLTESLLFLVFVNVSHFAQANAAIKNCKRVCLALTLTDRKTKHMGITKCIYHWATSG